MSGGKRAVYGRDVFLVALCYIRMFVVEQHYQNATGKNHSLAAGNYWERKLSSVQGRYLRSL